MGMFVMGMFGLAASAQNTAPPRAVDVKASDGTPLKATYFAAAKPGPGVLLLHQSNRDRKSWDFGTGAACNGRNQRFDA